MAIELHTGQMLISWKVAWTWKRKTTVESSQKLCKKQNIKTTTKASKKLREAWTAALDNFGCFYSSVSLHHKKALCISWLLSSPQLEDQQQHKHEQKRPHYRLFHIFLIVFSVIIKAFCITPCWFIVFTIYVLNIPPVSLWNEPMLTTTVQVNY